MWDTSPTALCSLSVQDVFSFAATTRLIITSFVPIAWTSVRCSYAVRNSANTTAGGDSGVQATDAPSEPPIRSVSRTAADSPGHWAPLSESEATCAARATRATRSTRANGVHGGVFPGPSIGDTWGQSGRRNRAGEEMGDCSGPREPLSGRDIVQRGWVSVLCRSQPQPQREFWQWAKQPAAHLRASAHVDRDAEQDKRPRARDDQQHA